MSNNDSTSPTDEKVKIVTDYHHHMLNDAKIRVEYGFNPCCDVYFRVSDERIDNPSCDFVDDTGTV